MSTRDLTDAELLEVIYGDGYNLDGWIPTSNDSKRIDELLNDEYCGR